METIVNKVWFNGVGQHEAGHADGRVRSSAASVTPAGG
jgi:hypothetical protein